MILCEENMCHNILIAASHSIINEGINTGKPAAKQASRAVSMEIAFVITLPIKPVRWGSGHAACTDP